MAWEPDDSALELLECAGPFEQSAYRAACVSALSAAEDVSFGGHLADGARAAAALVRVGSTAQSCPYGYGGIRSTRSLSDDEIRSFLEQARAAGRAPRVVVRAVDLGANEQPGRVVGTTTVAYLSEEPEAGFAKKARQSIRRAIRAGGSCEASGDPEPFLSLYANASREWGMQYPAELVRATAAAGITRFYDVLIDRRVDGSAVALVGNEHWMYWFAAQNEAGRDAEVGYLAVATMLSDAHSAGVGAVNLGASARLPGVAYFKHRLGGVERPMHELRAAGGLVALLDRARAISRNR